MFLGNGLQDGLGSQETGVNTREAQCPEAAFEIIKLYLERNPWEATLALSRSDKHGDPHRYCIVLLNEGHLTGWNQLQYSHPIVLIVTSLLHAGKFHYTNRQTH